MLINASGPGDIGVGLVRGDPKGLDAVGGGRFYVVSWDSRGANASSRVRFFAATERSSQSRVARSNSFTAAGS